MKPRSEPHLSAETESRIRHAWRWFWSVPLWKLQLVICFVWLVNGKGEYAVILSGIAHITRLVEQHLFDGDAAP